MNDFAHTKARRREVQSEAEREAKGQLSLSFFPDSRLRVKSSSVAKYFALLGGRGWTEGKPLVNFFTLLQQPLLLLAVLPFLGDGDLGQNSFSDGSSCFLEGVLSRNLF